MLQALFALALVISFLPMLANKAIEKKESRENVATVSQINYAWNAARSYIHNESDKISDGITTLSDDELSNKLEPFGLPLGFVPITPLGQKISLIISKKDNDIFSVVEVDANNMSEMRRANIVKRLGFWGIIFNGNGTLQGWSGGWQANELPNNLMLKKSNIYIRVPDDAEFSELVIKKAKNPSENSFHTNLVMNGNSISSIAILSSNSAKIKNVLANDFMLTGIEADKKNKNDIGTIRAGKIWFSAQDGNPLSITRSDLKTGLFISSSVANYGDLPALTADKLKIGVFNMTAGRTGFTGPREWDIKTSAEFTNISLSVERLTIASFLDTSRGQDVFINADNPKSLEYETGSGISAKTVKTDNIILRDQISSDLLAGGSGAAMLEIRPAGTSVFPDVLVYGINNDSLNIPLAADQNDGKLEPCKNIIAQLGGQYNAASVSDNIICQFVMLNRIEHRIEIKKCLMNGGTNCK
jgi:hypothetical protein